jgi:hypothetical protein
VSEDDRQILEETDAAEAADAAEAPPPPPSWPLWWVWRDASGAEADSGAGTATGTEDGLTVSVSGGMDFAVAWTDIRAVEEGGHRLTLSLHDDTVLLLHKAGRLHDELVRTVMAHWEKTARTEALVEEKRIAEFNAYAADSACRVEVYETALCVTFPSGDVVRMPFVFAEMSEDNHRFRVAVPGGEALALSRFGRDTDRFRDAVDSARKTMQGRALEFVRGLAPGLTPLQARALAASFLDGHAAPCAAMQAQPKLWQGVEAALERAGILPAYKTLSAMDKGTLARMGIKRGLRAGADEAYVFVMVPAGSAERPRIVFEAASDAATARATYVFDAAALAGGTPDIDTAMDVLNYGLYMVNFRREPIYMSDAQLEKPSNLHYKRALERIPALPLLRRAYVGRVPHGDGWQAKVEALAGRE